ncbi:hypothetical protein EDC94DRAFT_647143 [Helicostylum pulchrum]|nr:hypothetical protein EDC94DRAFT_647143 [Helicostylum pulchrum]
MTTQKATGGRRLLNAIEDKSSSLYNAHQLGIENTIAKIQKELVETKALRSGCKWRELGETSAGYLKRTITVRSIKKNITSLQPFLFSIVWFVIHSTAVNYKHS